MILSIETSCDETAVALLDDLGNILNEEVYTQIELHQVTKGVVPEVAAREQLNKITEVVYQVLLEFAQENNIANKNEKKLKEDQLKAIFSQISAIVYTKEPGLIWSLLVGRTAAKTLGWLFNKKVVGINHILGHISANFIGLNTKEINWPIVVLTASGGHNEICLLNKTGEQMNYQVIGQTLDDAAGEAFDKVAKMLDLSYPGGPIISRLADEFKTKYQSLNYQDEFWNIKNGQFFFQDKQYSFLATLGLVLPRPMKYSPDFNFSFSGLKTAVLYLVKKRTEPFLLLGNTQNKGVLKQMFPNKELSLWWLDKKDFTSFISYLFQEAVVNLLSYKLSKAVIKFQAQECHLSGGVSANKQLRQKLIDYSEEKWIRVRYPKLRYCTDNAAMIGRAYQIFYL